MNQGWVKLHRKLLDHPRRKDPEWVALWVHLLLLATHKPIDMVFGGPIITLNPGQFITSRPSLVKLTGLDRNKVERLLTIMESEQQIEQRKTTVSRLITIVNWVLYQETEQPTEQRVSNGRATSEQRVSTNKNEKNERIEIKESTAPGRKQQKAWPSLEEVMLYADKVGLPPEEAKKFYDHYEGTGWTDKHGNPVHDWQSKCRTWKTNYAERKHLDRVKNNPLQRKFVPGNGPL